MRTADDGAGGLKVKRSKKDASRLAAVREKVARRLAGGDGAACAYVEVEPRYDEVFANGTRWLNGLAEPFGPNAAWERIVATLGEPVWRRHPAAGYSGRRRHAVCWLNEATWTWALYSPSRYTQDYSGTWTAEQAFDAQLARAAEWIGVVV